MHPRARLSVLAVVTWLGLAACASSDAAAPATRSTIGGVGTLPGTLAPTSTTQESPESAESTESTDSTDAPDESSPVDGADAREADDESRPVGRLVEGNHVLVIGDSILASISNRYSDQLCARLVPRNWAVEVDAEVSRFIEFGRQVLDRRGGEEWDAAVVMLGNNYDGDPVAFGRELEALLDELAPKPVVLLNVTRFEPEQDEVNYVLAETAGKRDGVWLLDWASRTAEGAPDAERLLAGDGLHLSTEGQDALAAMISTALGSAPRGSEGECLESPFRDDTGGTMPREVDGESSAGDR